MANNYSVKQVTASFGGVPINAGRGPDDGPFVKIEKISEKRFAVKSGLDGSVTYFENTGNFHKVTLIMMQGSESNDFLTSVFKGDVLAGNGVGIASLLVKDGLGTSFHMDPEARIEDLPDEEYAAEPGTREWVFLSPNPERNVGSN